MSDVNYDNSYNEVLEILKYIPKSDYNKIPKDAISQIKKRAGNTNKRKWHKGLPLKYQELSDEAIDIMTVLYKKYMSSDNEKARFKVYDAMRRKEIEEERARKYNSDNIFKNIEKHKFNDSIEEKDIHPIETKRIGFFKKIVNRIKGMFKS